MPCIIPNSSALSPDEVIFPAYSTDTLYVIRSPGHEGLQLFADESITRAQDSALKNQYHFNRIHLSPSSSCVILKSI